MYKELKSIEVVRLSLLEKLDVDEKSDAITAVEEHFLCLMQFQEEFFNKIWEYIRKSLQIAQHEPHFLVKVLRIIESDRKNNEYIKKKFIHLVCLFFCFVLRLANRNKNRV